MATFRRNSATARSTKKSIKSRRSKTRKQLNLGLELLEARITLDSAWQNAVRPLDVDANGVLEPLDALLVINQLNSQQVINPDGSFKEPRDGVPPPFYDVDGDGKLAPLDALIVINRLNLGSTAPRVVAALKSDTGEFGITNADTITKAPTLAGLAIDEEGPVSSVTVSIDGGPEIPVNLSSNGTFEVSLLPTDGSSDGLHNVVIRVKDQSGTAGDPFNFTFTLDSTPPRTPEVRVDPLTDSGAIGDGETNFNSVYLIGETSPNTFVRLEPSNQLTQSDQNGRFVFVGVPLSLGVNSFTVNASDSAGNIGSNSVTVTRVSNLIAPVVFAELKNDTGTGTGTNLDRITRDPTIQGSVSDRDNSILRVEYRLDNSPSQSVTLSPSGNFSITPQLAVNGSNDGPHTIEIRATDATNLVSELRSVSFVLDTVPPTLTGIQLDSLSDSPPLSDGSTTIESVNLIGQAPAGTAIKLDPGGFEAVASPQGSFALIGVPLTIGTNSLNFSATDVAGNQSSQTFVVTRQATATGPTIVVDNQTSIVSNSNVTISGQVDGHGFAIESLLAQVDVGNAEVISLGTNGRFTFTTNLPQDGRADGQHQIRLRATDSRGIVSPAITIQWQLDTQPPVVSTATSGLLRDYVSLVELNFSEPVNDFASQTNSYAVYARGNPNHPFALSSITKLNERQYRLELAEPLRDGSFALSIAASVADLGGNFVTPASFAFDISAPPRMEEVSPRDGEDMVSLTRETVIRFDKKVDPSTITTSSIQITAAGLPVPGTIRVSPTETFATYFYSEPLPPSTLVKVVVDGDTILGRDGLPLDANDDSEPGGEGSFEFRTLPLTLVANTSVWGYVYDSYNRIPQELAAIAVPAGDPQFDPSATGTAKIPFARAEFYAGTGTDQNNPRLHPNRVSSYMDASLIYGSDEGRARALRTLDGSGKLKTSAGNLLPRNDISNFPDGALPIDNKGTHPTNHLPVAGDVRAAEFPGLEAIHTIFLREHNRKAVELKAAHPNWSDEELYQTARKWISALLQQITYYEYLPSILGTNPLPVYSGYKENVDPSVTALFSTAAFRLGHSQQTSQILRLDNNGNSLSSGPLSLRDAFFNPDAILTDGIDPFIRGLVSQTAEEVDTKMVDDLRNFLFGAPGAGGMDLASIGIQRGRDLGLPSYVKAREQFGLPAISSFGQITSNPAVATALQQIYGSIDKIDVWVGGFAEDHLSGASVGPLFAAVIKDQFQRSRDGDRFWFENQDFSTTELNEIRSTTFAELIERNTAITNLSSNVFSRGTTPATQTIGGGPGIGIEFRTFDGSSNHLTKPRLGTTNSPLLSSSTNGFGDGISSLGGADRPNPRAVSNGVFAQATSIPSQIGLTSLATVFGQFISHDFSLTPAQSNQGTDIPVIGAEISLNALPQIKAVTDKFGFFELTSASGLPVPEFFVHIDGGKAVNAPSGTSYATLGKPFHSVAGEHVQLVMDGTPFSIYLPPMAMGDVVPLSPSAETVVGFGNSILGNPAQLASLFPDLSPSQRILVSETRVIYPPNSATDADGTVASQAMIIPVNPNRLPAPLPPGVDPGLVISIQAGTDQGFNLAGGNMNFQNPATVVFPNLNNLNPGEKSLLWSFDHDAGDWSVVGTGTVSPDGKSITSDPGMGVRAPGWHFFDPSTRYKPKCQFNTTDVFKIIWDLGKAATQCLANGFFEELSEGLEAITKMIGIVENVYTLMANIQESINSGDSVNAQQVFEDVKALKEDLVFFADLVSRKSNVVISKGRLVVDCLNQILEAASEICDTITSASRSCCNTSLTKTVCDGVDIVKFTLGRVLNGLNLVEESQGRIAVGAICLLLDSIELALNLANSRTTRNASGEDPNLNALVSDLLIALNSNREATTQVRNALLSFSELKTTTQSFESNSESLYQSQSPALNGYFSITFNDVKFLGRTDSEGSYSFIIPPNVDYRLTVYDPTNARIAFLSGTSGGPGSENLLPPLQFVLTANLVDSDLDGLVDVAESTVGTSTMLRDTDGDGILDLDEILQESDPLGGGQLPIGLIGNLGLDNSTNAIEVFSFGEQADRMYAVTANGAVGISILDVTSFQNPVVVSRFSLAGNAVDVAVDPSAKIVAVGTTDAGMHFVDISNVSRPRLIRSSSASSSELEIVDGILYAAIGNSLHGYDALTGEVQSTYLVPNAGTITRLAHQDNYIYALDNSLKLHVIKTDPFVSTKQGEIQLTQGAGEISISRNILYVGAQPAFQLGGFVTVDVGNANNPQLISNSDLRDPFIAPGIAVVPTDSGFGLAVGYVGRTGNSPVAAVVDLRDPQVTNNYLTQFALPGNPQSAVIASGIGFIAAGTGGVAVVNYLSFDSQGVPPSVSAVGPPGNSIQEGLQVSIRSNVSDDVQVRDVELLMNGQVVAKDVTPPFDLRAVVPSLLNASQVSFQVKATDTGGNVGFSGMLNYALTPDITGPKLIGSIPADGSAGFRTQAITLRFDEPIETARLSLASFQLLDLGANFIPGGGDDKNIVIDRIEVLSPQRVVIFTDDPLAEGRYRLQGDTSTIRDIAGNPASTLVAITFTSFDLDEQNSIAWISDTDGDWNNAANWSAGRVPTANDQVIIDRKTADPKITISTGQITVRSIVSKELFALAAGSLTVSQSSSFSNGFVMSSGTQLSAKGANTVFSALGSTVINGASLIASGGAVISLPTISHIQNTGNNVVYRALDPGSIVDLSNTQSLTQSSNNRAAITIEAHGGGKVKLPSLIQYVDPSTGDTQGRTINLKADGLNSQIDLSSLAQLHDVSSADHRDCCSVVEGMSSVQALTGGSILMPALRSVTGTEFRFTSNGGLPFSNLTSFRDGSINIVGTSLNFAALTDARLTQITVNGNGQATFPVLTNIDGMNFFVDRSVIQIPVATQYTNSLSAPVWRATGDGASIELPQLATLTQSSNNRVSISIEALSGGKVKLPNLIQYVDPSTGDTQGRTINLKSDGLNSQIDLSSLAQLHDVSSADHRDCCSVVEGMSSVQALTGGSILMPALRSVTGTEFRFTSNGGLPFSNLTSFRDGSINIVGTSLNFAALTDARLTQITVNGNGQATFPVLTNIDGMNFFVDRSVIQIPVATQYTNSLSAPVWRATGDGASIELPQLATLTQSSNNRVSITIEALSGGKVRLPNLIQYVDPSTGDTQGRTINLKADGLNSQIDLSSLAQLHDVSSADHRDCCSVVEGMSSVQALTGGSILMPALRSVTGTEFRFTSNGGLPFSNLTSFRDGSINIVGTSLNFAALTDARLTQITVNGNGQATFPVLTNIDGMNFFVDRSVIQIPVATQYTNSLSAPVWRATGDGASIELPQLATLTQSSNNRVSITIEALSGGKVKLPNLIQYVDPSTGDTQGRTINLKSDGLNSQIDLSSLAQLHDVSSADHRDCCSVVEGMSSVQALTGGSILMPALRSVTGTEFRFTSNGGLPFSNLTSFRDGSINIVGTSLNFAALTDARLTQITVNGNGQATFPVLTNIDGMNFFVDRSVIQIPVATQYTNSLSAPVWRATGDGASIELPQLATLTQSSNNRVSITIEALSGGKVRLPNLIQYVDPSTGDTQGRTINLKADGLNSQIDLSSLAQLHDVSSADHRDCCSVVEGMSSVQALAGGSLKFSANQTDVKNTSIQIDSLSKIIGQLRLSSGTELTGTGTVEGTIINDAGFQPGGPTGRITLTANMTQSNLGSTTIEIGGTDPGLQYDSITIGGTASIAGSLDVRLLNGFSPSVGTSFSVLSAGLLSGTFTNITGLNIGSGKVFIPVYSATGLSLQVASALSTFDILGPAAALQVDLSINDTEEMLEAARDAWGPELAVLLHDLVREVRIVDLPDNLLAAQLDDLILLDHNAAGWGWFVDATPNDDQEFVIKKSQGVQLAANGSIAASRIDLLTTLLHELGHALGLSHDVAEGDEGSLMNEFFSIGERRKLNSSLIDQVMKQWN